jgi:alpha/beta superfamily hydrolase
VATPVRTEGWLDIGPERVFAALHAAGPAVRATGVVLCGPFGWEATSAHRAIRTFADRLADAGFPTIWFSWPGSGDSTGDDHQPDLIDRWHTATAVAADALRGTGTVDRIALVGIRGGALVACEVAGRIGASQLALWAVPASGRAYLRELRAAHAASTTTERPGSAPERPAGSTESFGYVLGSSATTRIEAMRLDTILAQTRLDRALIVARDGLRTPGSVVEALQATGAEVTQLNGVGYAAMVTEANLSVPATAVFNQVADWLAAGAGEALTAPPRLALASQHDGPGYRERLLVVGGPSVLRGVATTPAAVTQGQTWVVFLNAGRIPRVGPNRMWTGLSRRLASAGTPTARFDLGAIGDSDGEAATDVDSLYDDRRGAEIGDVLDHLRMVEQADRFILVGLCSGALLAFRTIAVRDDVAGAVMINPWGLEWAGLCEQRTKAPTREWLTRTPARLRLLRALRRAAGARRGLRRALGRGRSSAAPATSAEVDERIRRTAERVTSTGRGLHLVFADHDPGLALLRRGFGDDLAAWSAMDGATLEILPGNHTFTDVWSQPRLTEVVLDHVDGYVTGARSITGVRSASSDS